MNLDELEYLCSTQAQNDINQYLDCDPLKVAMNKHVQHSALIATQIKYLQKARVKLPSYYDARCVIPERGFEQCSSELCASVKDLEGELCIDLTCGLGVDTLHFSKRFRRVITLERDPIMAQIARVNFKRLGADNIEVVNQSAEDFLQDCTLKADLIYADPDRRNAEGKKQVVLEDCSPNMLALDARLREISDNIMIKCSPLFDIDEAFRLYGQHTQVEVISLAGECKELVIFSSKNIAKEQIKLSAIGRPTLNFEYQKQAENAQKEFLSEEYNFIVIPDVVLQKSRCAMRYYADFEGVYLENNNAVVFCPEALAQPYGVNYQIESIEIFNPKKLKKQLKEQGIKQVDILKRNFPLPAQQLAQSLGIKQGGVTKILFTELQNTKYTIKIK